MEKQRKSATFVEMLVYCGMLLGMVMFAGGALFELLLTHTDTMTTVQAINFHGQSIALLIFGYGLVRGSYAFLKASR